MKNIYREKSSVPAFGTWGVDTSAWDTSIVAGDDFFQHANGGWLRDYQLPADKVMFGPINQLRDQAEIDVREIIAELGNDGHRQGSIEQKINDLFNSYMNIEKRNLLGIAPIQAGLDNIRSSQSKEDLIRLFGRADLEGLTSPLSSSVSMDQKNPDRYVVILGYGGLGLPDRDFYLQDNPRFVSVRAAYAEHIVRMLAFAGFDAKEAQIKADDIIKLETRLAGHHWPRSELREVKKTYNSYTYAELKSEFTGFDWDLFFNERGISPLEELIVRTPSAIAPVLEEIRDTPIKTWQAYLSFSLVEGSAGFLSEEIDNAAFEFQKMLSGAQAQRDLWKRAVSFVSGVLGEAIGQLYVARHFPESSRRLMDELVANLLAAYGERIPKLPWMSDGTKQNALAKLETFNPKIAYPNKWRDYSELSISNDLMANVKAGRTFRRMEDIGRLGKKTDRDEWFMSPQTVNAYYNPVFNEVVFPAAILQPPMFDPSADPAVNYGAIGAIIGHEIGHGFDDQGSRYDEFGVLNDWWNPKDRVRFEARTSKLVDQFSGYSPVEGVFVNGQFTLGENIGDLGGLGIAYHAYRKSLKGTEAPLIDGLTGDQRFFLSWAQAWKSVIRDESMVNMVTSDPHSPPEFRVNGIVCNLDAWYEAFDVTESNALYKPRSERVNIW